MITIISLLFSAAYLFSMLYFVSHTVWYLILIWAVTSILVFYIISGIQIVGFSILIMPFLKQESKFKYFFVRSLARWLAFFLFYLTIKVEGRENVPLEGKLTIYANHKSKIDPAFVTVAVRRAHGYAAKSDLRKYPVTKQIVEGVNSFYVYRQDNRATLKELLRGIKNAKDGFAHVIFPEGGTMHRDHEDITAVRTGAFKLVEKAETDILPVTILGSNRRGRKKRFFFVPAQVKVIVHKPIKFEEVANLDTSQIADKVIDIINSPFN